MSPRYKALGLAMQKYADQNGNFDRVLWAAAFESDDPSVILDVRGLTGVFDDLLNNLTEMMLVAATERQLAVTTGPKPRSPALYDAVAADGGLTRSQATELKDLNWVRNQFQHSSPTITTDEAYEAIVRLHRAFRGLAQSFAEWLKAHHLEHLLVR